MASKAFPTVIQHFKFLQMVKVTLMPDVFTATPTILALLKKPITC